MKINLEIVRNRNYGTSERYDIDFSATCLCDGKVIAKFPYESPDVDMTCSRCGMNYSFSVNTALMKQDKEDRDRDSVGN